MASACMRSPAFVLTGIATIVAAGTVAGTSGRSRSTNGGGAQARRGRWRTRPHRRRRACDSARGRRRAPQRSTRRPRSNGCTTGTTSRSIRPASIIRRSAWARRTRSATSSGPADRAARWPSSTSPSSRWSTRSIGATRATWACRQSDRPRRWTRASPRPRTTRWSRCFPRRRRSATSCWRPISPRCRTAPPGGTACCSAARSPPASC